LPVTFKILDRSTPPPGGWKYVQPESGRIFKHYARDAFFAEIRDHRLSQGYPIEPDWQERIEDQLCREHPEWGRQICGRTERYGERRPISLAAMQSFINVMATWITGILRGREVFVPQAEADRRARICLTCEFNMSIPGSCGACADRIARAITIIGSRKTEYDAALGACALCSCVLRVAVHVPLEAQHAGLSKELKEDFRKVDYCWKREGL
jgi:hypothetical protein